MIIALGLLIDNAIIVVEDYRYRKLDGLSSNDAIFASVKHLFLPLLAATATTAFAFMPIIVGEGPSNEYIGGMAMTLIAAISTSLSFVITCHFTHAVLFRKTSIFASHKICKWIFKLYS